MMSESRVRANRMHGSKGSAGEVHLNGETGNTPTKETCGTESVRPTENAKPVAYLTVRGWIRCFSEKSEILL